MNSLELDCMDVAFPQTSARYRSPEWASRRSMIGDVRRVVGWSGLALLTLVIVACVARRAAGALVTPLSSSESWLAGLAIVFVGLGLRSSVQLLCAEASSDKVRPLALVPPITVFISAAG